MSSLLWFFLSEETIPFIIVLIGMALIVGAMTGGQAARALRNVLLFALVLPFIPLLIDLLPWWAVLLAVVFGALSLLQAILAAGFGARAADHAIGTLLATLILMGARLLLWPVRAAFAVLRTVLITGMR